MRIQKGLASIAAVCLIAACGASEVTRGDIYSACVDGHMRDFDAKENLVLSVVSDDEKPKMKREWAVLRTKEVTDAEKACGCSADNLPERIANDRLPKVIALYKSQGTMGSDSKFKALTESEQAEVTKCLAQVQVDRMRREGLIE